MTQIYQYSDIEEDVFLNRQNIVQNVGETKPYCHEILQMYNNVTTSNLQGLADSEHYCPEISQIYSSVTTCSRSEHSDVKDKPQTHDHQENYFEISSQCTMYEAEAHQPCEAGQELHARVNLPPASGNGVKIPAETAQYNMFGYQESFLQYPFNVEGNTFTSRQPMPSGTIQKQAVPTNWALSEHVSFYHNSYKSRTSAFIPDNINSVDFQLKDNCSANNSECIYGKDKNHRNISPYKVIRINNSYNNCGLENAHESGLAASLPNKRGASRAGRRRKRMNTPDQRAAANIRERRRMCHLNVAFDRLKDHLPDVKNKTKLSRIEILKAAIYYIGTLSESLRLC